MVELVDININDTDSTKYSIKFFRGNKMMVTKEFLKSRNVLETGSITISSEYYFNKSKNLTQEQIENIMFLEVLLTLQHKLKSYHENLSHLHLKSMVRLAKLEVLPSRFLDMKDYFPGCASFIFVTESRQQWIIKIRKAVSIRK